LKHDQEEVYQSEENGTQLQQADGPDVPSLHGHAQVEIADRKLEEVVGNNVK
jgi:hypothetical protein